MKKFVIILTFILLLLLITTAAGAREIYTVQPGDSLYKLSQRYGVSISEIKESNSLDSNMIYIGQKLIIPVESESDNQFTYTVRPGDSLYKISRRFDTTVSKLMEVNNLNSYLIYVDQELIIPRKREGKEENRTKSYGSISGQIKVNNRTQGTKPSGETINTEMVSSLNTSTEQPIYNPSEIIVKYKPVISEQSVDDFEKENKITRLNVMDSPEGRVTLYRLPEEKTVEKVVEEYREMENVEWAEPNYILYPTAVPNDTYYNRHQWNHVNLNLEAAWDQQKGNKEVKVALLDTGIIPNHPDLKANLLSGADFVGGDKSYPITNYNLTDNDPTDETTLIEGGSHGTHVAGIIGAVTNNYRGVAGVNWQVNILPVRVLSKKGGTSWDVAEGIYYALDQGADVINLSLGGPHSSYLQKSAVNSALNQNVAVIAASGNEGSSSVFYPAAIEGVIAVGAVDKKNNKTHYSNYGPEIDVVAPGGGYGESIYSTWGYYDQGSTTSSYGGMIGTSMATPHVTGIAALLVAEGIEDPADITAHLSETAIDLGEKGPDDYYGYGLVDAYAALLGRKLNQPQIFAAITSGNELEVKSEIVTANSDGSFTLNNITAERVKIIGWRDVNQNNRIDRGDYYGESDSITVQDYDISNINFNLNYTTRLNIRVNK